MKPDKIIADVAEHTGISVEELLGKSRKEDVKNARQLVYYLACCVKNPCTVTGQSLNRHHSTVLRGASVVMRTPALLEEAQTIIALKLYYKPQDKAQLFHYYKSTSKKLRSRVKELEHTIRLLENKVYTLTQELKAKKQSDFKTALTSGLLSRYA